METSHTSSEKSNAVELPPVRRARGYHLYDLRGKRYLDLHLQGGRALLGHRPEGILLELKNIAARGLLGAFPSPYDGRLQKAIATLIPGCEAVRVFANEERLKSALQPLIGACELKDPVLVPDASDSPLQRWRPFLPDTEPVEGPLALVPVLPFPGAFAPVVVCLRGFPDEKLPPSDTVSPALLGALVRSAYSLQRTINSIDTRHWESFEAPWWRRVGPYLIADCEKGEYSRLFSRLLEEGIYINPDYPGPSVIPMEYTHGEIKPLKRAIGDWEAKRERN